MRADQYSRIDSIKIKARADYKCQCCDSDNAIQAHALKGDHTDWRKGIALCADCHADEHPDVPRSLFISKVHKPYWHNISARALAIKCGCHTRTVIRSAKRLGIASNCDLSNIDKKRIKSSVRMKAKIDRNQRLIDYWVKHPGMTYQAIAKIFHISKPRAWLIINQENKRLVGISSPP